MDDNYTYNTEKNKSSRDVVLEENVKNSMYCRKKDKLEETG